MPDSLFSVILSLPFQRGASAGAVITFTPVILFRATGVSCSKGVAEDAE